MTEAILNESNEVVPVGTLPKCNEAKHDFACPNADIEEGYAASMSIKPDKSAQNLRLKLERHYNSKLGVIISDT